MSNTKLASVQCQNGIVVDAQPWLAKLLTSPDNAMVARPLRGADAQSAVDPFAHLDAQKPATTEAEDGDGGVDIGSAPKRAGRPAKSKPATDDVGVGVDIGE
jgi:hypothetical protein